MWPETISKDERNSKLEKNANNKEERDFSMFRLIGTTSSNDNYFRIWILNCKSQSLSPHIKIETSLIGIKYIISSSDT